jgi:hypothetical protein
LVVIHLSKAPVSRLSESIKAELAGRSLNEKGRINTSASLDGIPIQPGRVNPDETLSSGVKSSILHSDTFEFSIDNSGQDLIPSPQVIVKPSELSFDEGLVSEDPLSQTNFFPDLMHVKVLPKTTEVIPSVLQDVPVLTAEFAGTAENDVKNVRTMMNVINFLYIYYANEILI